MYQRFQELLDARTLDVYQYNHTNVFVACNELLEVIVKTLEGNIRSRRHVDEVRAETLEIIKADKILQIHDRFLYTTLMRIVSQKVVGKSKAASDGLFTDPFHVFLNRIRFQMETPVKMLKHNYLGFLLDSLWESIQTKKNDEIELYLTSLVGQCINQGWSTNGLSQLLGIFEGEMSAEDKWSTFKHQLFPTPSRRFQVFYGIKIGAKRGLSAEEFRNTILSLGLILRRGSEIISEQSGMSPEFTSHINSKGNYLVVDIKATDHDAAILLAINSVNRSLSVATFFNLLDPEIAESHTLIALSCEEGQAKPRKIADIFRTHEYVDRKNTIFDDTRKIFLEEEKSTIMNRLHASFSYTNLSRTSSFQETKFITLWIAMEAVMQTGQFDNIISHIKCVLPEIIAIRYFYRIIRNFSEDCVRCGFISEDDLDLDMKESNKRLLVTKLLDIFRDDFNYEILERRCMVSTLLVFRCKQTRELLTSIQLIQECLTSYTAKTRWHIQRLYRIRNEITHS
ncbi:MAG: hypothetical protein GX809_03720, partial [Clostridiaceae bacterium]|nr:hypothetical protein [Clostridiaceae bacterium]